MVNPTSPQQFFDICGGGIGIRKGRQVQSRLNLRGRLPELSWEVTPWLLDFFLFGSKRLVGPREPADPPPDVAIDGSGRPSMHFASSTPYKMRVPNAMWM